ncbi:hypothetical protein [Streptomyces sp. NPDC017993]|uniref:hypothetical protein n=1 Tax=Streptomyces sp. NPDC017993 TaxID=3365027 RepID=UPI0037B9F2D5
MRLVSRTLAASALAVVALGTAVPTAFADPVGEVSPSAAVSPTAVGPGGTITLTVLCGRRGGHPPETITGHGQVLTRGTVLLKRVDATGTYAGSARVTDKLAAGQDRAGERPVWAIDGTCPGGKSWSATVRPQQVTGPHAGSPHGAMQAGTGGAAGNADLTMITAGSTALAAAACGCYLLARRRPRDDG